MKSLHLYPSLLLLFLSINCLSQNHIYSYNTSCSSNNTSFANDIITEFFVHEVLGIYSNSRYLYFDYLPHKNNWRLKNRHYKRNNKFYSNARIIARFENPNGGRDFIIKVNRRGDWFLDCPKKFRKILKHKVKKNTYRY